MRGEHEFLKPDKMEQEVTNFGKFYSLLRELPCDGDRDELKRQLVWQYTLGHTEHLHEMTRCEYDSCCAGMERMIDRKGRLRKARSASLRLMQQLGVNTSDWTVVDNFCRHPRIAGKRFCEIRLCDMPDFQRKLRAIGRRGGLSPRRAEQGKGGALPVFLAAPIVEGGVS